MVSKRLSIFGFISAAALVSGVLIGCGGSSSSTQGINPIVTVTGGITTAPGSTTTSVPASTTPQQVQVTTGGATVPAVVPPGQPALTTTSVVSVTPANHPFLTGVTFGPSVKRAPTAHPLNISYDSGATYAWTGINVLADGSFDKALVLASGTSCYLQAVGPFSVTSTTGGFIKPQLTVGQFVFGIIVDSSGLASYPSDLNMRIPGNGGSTTSGNYVNVTYPTPNFSTGIGTLTLTWTGVTKVQSKTVVGGLCAFSDPLSDGTDAVPSTGVTTVKYLYNK